MNKKFVLVIGLSLALLLVVGTAFILLKDKSPVYVQPKVASFLDCIKVAGSQIRESYPAVCVLPTGEEFTQDINEEPPTDPSIIPPEMDVLDFEDCTALSGSVTQGVWCYTPGGLAFTNEVFAPPADAELPVAPTFYDSILDMMTRKTSDSGMKDVSGTLVTGASLSKDYCPEGIYLQDASGVVQVRVADGNGGVALYSDTSLLGKEVEVTGIYPGQEVYCSALLCECEDFILAEGIIPVQVPMPVE